MSKIDSRKALNSVYRRCLSALNQGYKHPLPSAENCRKFEDLAAEMAKLRKHPFANAEECRQWTEKKYWMLYHREQDRLFKDPNASLKAWIEGLMADAA
jgi:hypothetical protein